MSRACLIAVLIAGCGGNAGSTAPTIDSVAPNFGPVGGGTTVTVTGTNFLADGAPPNHVVFGDVEAPLAAAVDNLNLQVTVPPGDAPGDVPITVFNRNGTVTAMGVFHYSALPTVTSVSPNEVLATDTSTTVTVTGSGFQGENAGVNTVLVGGQQVVDITVVSDTQITFTALPHDPLTRPDVQVVNNRGAGALTHGLRFIPSTLPVLVAFPIGRFSESSFVTFFEPTMGAKIVTPSRVALNPQFGGFRAVVQDTNGDFWAVQRDDTLGRVDFDQQALTDTQKVANAHIVAMVSFNGTVFAFDRNTASLGTLDLTSATFTKIGTVSGVNTQVALATDGTSLFIAGNGNGVFSVAKIDPTTAVRSDVVSLSKAEHIGEMRFINGQLIGTANTGDVFSLEPATGTVTTLTQIGVSAALEVFTPGGVQ